MIGTSLVCCYCFERFAPADMAFRCIAEPSRCKPEQDSQLSKYMNTPQIMPRIVTPPRGWTTQTSALCACGTRTTRQVCPHCHNNLPSQYGQLDHFTIALVGAKEAGKSHYVCVLIHELANRVGSRFNASLSALDDRTIRRYKDEFKRSLYDRKEPIRPTHGATGVQHPLAYRLTIERRGFLKRGLRMATMVFFDTAGEDLNSLDRMSLHTRYISNSQGLIFLIDPLQISAVRDRVGSSMPLPGEHTEPDEIVARVAALIRESTGVIGRLKTPVAVTFSKIDALLSQLPPGSPLRTNSAHDGCFDLDDAESIHDTLRSMLVDGGWNAALDNVMRGNFETYAYFGVSALGQAPVDGRLTLGAVSPFRVEDPFLWILHRQGLLEGRRSRG